MVISHVGCLHFYIALLGLVAGRIDIPTETEKTLLLKIIISSLQKFSIVSTHDTHPDLYNVNVDRFLQQVSANDELPLGTLGIRSTSSTVAPSGARTPNQGPIRLKQEKLGTGHFAVVRRF